MEMILVKGGTFTMGATPEQGEDFFDDEIPAHEVTVSDFYIGKYLVTQKEWEEIMGDNPSHFKGDDLPVESVSWDDVQDFITKLNQKTGKTYRLPTEAEWEYAARGGIKSQGYKYAGSNNLDEVARYCDNSQNKTHPVGSMRSNELFIHDMSGNLFEWCEDNWHSNYFGAPSTGEAWIQNPTGFTRVIRGGDYDNVPRNCRISFRYLCAAKWNWCGGYIGFRLAMSV